MAEIKIKDESGDRKYWTQIPNYIANHSTANDQALYFQMKRYAGENGQCFATQETLMKKLGIGEKAYKKSLKYLIEKKWIKYIGLTSGKTRPIKTYSIVDIWKLNIMEYEKIPSESRVSFDRDTSQKEEDTSQKKDKIPSESRIEEEPVLIRTIKKNSEGDKSPLTLKEIYIKQIGTLNDEGEKFVSYWTEKNPNGKKERWQMERVFDIKRRWNTWQNNQERFEGRQQDKFNVVKL